MHIIFLLAISIIVSIIIVVEPNKYIIIINVYQGMYPNAYWLILNSTYNNGAYIKGFYNSYLNNFKQVLNPNQNAD